MTEALVWLISKLMLDYLIPINMFCLLRLQYFSVDGRLDSQISFCA